MEALRWFMHKHNRIPTSLQALYLNLARFILENNYVEYQDLREGSKIFLQKIGTLIKFNGDYCFSDLSNDLNDLVGNTHNQ
jgi:hypothetical protein